MPIRLLSILAKPIQDSLHVTDGQLGLIGGLYSDVVSDVLEGLAVAELRVGPRSTRAFH